MRQQQVRNLDVVHWQGLEDSLQALLLLQHLCLAARQHVRLLQHLYVAATQSPVWQPDSLSCCMQLCLCLPPNKDLSGSLLGSKAGAPPAHTPLPCSNIQVQVCSVLCLVLSESMSHSWPNTSLHQHLSVQWLEI